MDAWFVMDVWLAILAALVWPIGVELLLFSRLTDQKKGVVIRGTARAYSRRKAVLVSLTIPAFMAIIVLPLTQVVFGEDETNWLSAIVFGLAAGAVLVLLFELIYWAFRSVARHPVRALIIVTTVILAVAACYLWIPGLKEFVAVVL